MPDASDSVLMNYGPVLILNWNCSHEKYLVPWNEHILQQLKSFKIMFTNLLLLKLCWTQLSLSSMAGITSFGISVFTSGGLII